MASLSNKYHQKPMSSQEATLISRIKLFEHVQKAPDSGCVARHIILEPHTRHSVLVTTPALNIRTTKSKIMENIVQLMSAAYCVMDPLSLQPIYFLLSKFSAIAMHLPKQIETAHAADPLQDVMTPRSALHQRSSMGTFQESKWIHIQQCKFRWQWH